MLMLVHNSYMAAGFHKTCRSSSMWWCVNLDFSLMSPRVTRDGYWQTNFADKRNFLRNQANKYDFRLHSFDVLLFQNSWRKFQRSSTQDLEFFCGDLGGHTTIYISTSIPSQSSHTTKHSSKLILESLWLNFCICYGERFLPNFGTIFFSWWQFNSTGLCHVCDLYN